MIPRCAVLFPAVVDWLMHVKRMHGYYGYRDYEKCVIDICDILRACSSVGYYVLYESENLSSVHAVSQISNNFWPNTEGYSHQKWLYSIAVGEPGFPAMCPV